MGTWKGLRTQTGTYQFLSWTNHLKPDGRFTITFFRDAQQTQVIQTEQGSWSAADGRSELRTDGVRTPDVYSYKLVDPDTVDYVSVAASPEGDCRRAPFTAKASRLTAIKVFHVPVHGGYPPAH